MVVVDDFAANDKAVVAVSDTVKAAVIDFEQWVVDENIACGSPSSELK